jgi:hypothetical protein
MVPPEFISANKVYLKVKKTAQVCNIVMVLPSVIGIPLQEQTNELISIEEIFDIPSSSSAGSLQSPGGEVAFKKKVQQVQAMVSDGTILGASNDQDDMTDCISKYPISLILIRDNVAAGVFIGSENVCGLPFFQSEALTASECLYSVGVQHFPPADLVWLTGGTDKIKSMPVSVYSFTLLGSYVKICEPELFSGPFISYVREDDDYDAVVRRFGVVTGEAESEWNSYRLAVVLNKTPFFVTRGSTSVSASSSANNVTEGHDIEESHTNGQGNNNGGEEKEKEKEGVKEGVKVKKILTVYERLLEKYRYLDVCNVMKNKNIMEKNNAIYKNRFPQIGIQRSVTQLSIAAGGQRTNTSVGQSIKISG